MKTTKCSLCGEDIAVGRKALRMDEYTWICEDCVNDRMVDLEDELYEERAYLRERYKEVGY